MGRVYASKVYLSIEKAFPEVEGSCAETSSGPRGNTFIRYIIQIPPPNVNKKTVLHANMLRVSLNAEETVTVFPALFFLSEGRRKEVKTLNGYSYLTLEQRREIERMYAEGERVVDIAARLKRSAAAIYEELKRGYTGEFDGYARPKYSADLAQATVQENFRRRGNRRGANC